ncbi:16098_t:CDS:2, partial [Acaulospora morrowiae]
KPNGKLCLHKSKRNANNTFSIGKTWSLEEIRCIEVLDSVAFVITMSKPYCWTADKQRERTAFLTTLLKVYKKNTNRLPKLINFEDSSIS